VNKDHLVAIAMSGLTKLVAGATPRWMDCEPSTKQRIYFANHSSHLDAMVLWSALPPAVRSLVRPVAAKDYWVASRLRHYLATKVFNCVLIARPGKPVAGEESAGVRGPLKAIDDMVEAMGSEHSLIIFPEGTRGTGESIGTFKAGLHHLAKRLPDVELIPVFMENLSRILPKGEFLAIPLVCSISFGAPMSLRENESKSDFLARARDAVEGLSKA
jgi:1-acyl-sn-glycerol-3-phosphate acyltransferase